MNEVCLQLVHAVTQTCRQTHRITIVTLWHMCWVNRYSTKCVFQMANFIEELNYSEVLQWEVKNAVDIVQSKVRFQVLNLATKPKINIFIP